MQAKRCLIAGLLMMCAAFRANAKPISLTLETEVSVDKNHGNSFSQYVLFGVAPKESGVGWNGYMRYFDVSDGGPKHGELACGPTFRFGNYGEFRTKIGFTTDGALSAPGGTLITSVGGQTIVFISDPKIYLNKKSDTLFQRFVLPKVVTIYNIPIDIRAEHLLVCWNTHAFLRIGLQIPLVPQGFLDFLGENTTLTVSPFYEVEKSGVGSFFTLTLRE